MWTPYDPVAIDDYAFSATGDNVTGNVLANDYGVFLPQINLTNFGGVQVGAKHPGQVTTVQGQYGTFSLKADGSYTYQLSDAYKNTDLTTHPLTEKIQYKASDGAGHTDSATLTLDVGQMTHATHAPHDYTVTFDGKGASPFDYLQYGITFDESSYISIGQENGNHFLRSDEFGEGFFSKDHSLFSLKDMVVATGDVPGTSVEVEFIGRNNGGVVGTVTVDITANTISQHQVVDLSSLGPINSLSFTFLSFGGDWQDETHLLLDNIHMVI